LDKRSADIAGPVKSVGTYQMTVRLHPDVTVTVPFEVTTAG
jgi:large subunit ribosomal protein L9